MTIRLHSRRTFLSLLTVSVSTFSILSGCGNSKADIKATATKLASLLRFPNVAAHLGRLYVESDPNLQSLSIEALVTEILNDIGSDFSQVLDIEDRAIQQQLNRKIRQDFTDELVVTVDGWLLSKLEAKVCALVFRNIQQTQS